MVDCVSFQRLNPLRDSFRGFHVLDTRGGATLRLLRDTYKSQRIAPCRNGLTHACLRSVTRHIVTAEWKRWTNL